MSFILKRKNKSIVNIEKEIASEIVEIFEETLEKLNVTLPGENLNSLDKILRIKSEVRNELISEIEDFLYSNNKCKRKAA